MRIGYARVSTHEQHLDLQLQALEEAGCDKIFRDTVSGATAKRPGLDDALSHLREGDTLVIWRLDRLGRNLEHLLRVTRELEEAGVGFKSLTEHIDATTAPGKMQLQMLGVIAEFERNLIRERTMAGLKAARAQGRVSGRPLALNEQKQLLLYSLYDAKMRGENQHTIKDICELIGITKGTLYAYLRRRKAEEEASA